MNSNASFTWTSSPNDPSLAPLTNAYGADPTARFATPTQTTTYTATLPACGTHPAVSKSVTVTYNPTAVLIPVLAPSITCDATTNTICKGKTIKLTATGTLNSASKWFWYTGSCGNVSACIGNTFNGEALTYTPDATLTYFVRGESTVSGGVQAGPCASTTITVNNLPTIIASTIPSTSAAPTVSTTITVTGASTYSWLMSTNRTTWATADITPTTANNISTVNFNKNLTANVYYKIEGTDGNLCINSTSVNYLYNTQLTLANNFSPLKINTDVNFAIVEAASCSSCKYEVDITDQSIANPTLNDGGGRYVGTFISVASISIDGIFSSVDGIAPANLRGRINVDAKKKGKQFTTIVKYWNGTAWTSGIPFIIITNP